MQIEVDIPQTFLLRKAKLKRITYKFSKKNLPMRFSASITSWMNSEAAKFAQLVFPARINVTGYIDRRRKC